MVGDSPHQRTLFRPRDLPDCGPDVAHDPDRYRTWLRVDELGRCATSPSTGLTIDLFIRVCARRDRRATRKTIASIRLQTGATWRVVIVAPTHTRAASRRRSGGHATSVTVIGCAPDSLEATFERSVNESRADAICFLSPGDLLAPDALALLADALEGASAAYGDEDRQLRGGGFVDPVLKPDWSPQFALHSGYVGRPMVVRTDAMASVGGYRRYPDERDAELDLCLRVGEVGKIAHVAHVVCHRREATLRHHPSREVIEAHIARQGWDAAVLSVGRGHRIEWKIPDATKVAVVIPFRDSTRFLRNCIDSVSETTSGLDVGFLLVDNGSTDPETHSLVDSISRRGNVVVRYDPRPFNWARLNNEAARSTDADYLCFLNDDIEAPHRGWLAHLIAPLQDPTIAAVGARLVYPNGRLQHCGVVVGLGGAAGHLHVGLAAGEPGYLDMAITAREVSAVTGAALVTTASTFESLGGFDESLGVDLNDIDFCLRAISAGRRVLFEPAAELIHYESPTRGTSGSPENIRSFLARWEHYVRRGDPYLHRALTRLDSTAGLRIAHEDERWEQWRANLESM